MTQLIIKHVSCKSTPSVLLYENSCPPSLDKIIKVYSCSFTAYNCSLENRKSMIDVHILLEFRNVLNKKRWGVLHDCKFIAPFFSRWYPCRECKPRRYFWIWRVPWSICLLAFSSAATYRIIKIRNHTHKKEQLWSQAKPNYKGKGNVGSSK